MCPVLKCYKLVPTKRLLGARSAWGSVFRISAVGHQLAAPPIVELKSLASDCGVGGDLFVPHRCLSLNRESWGSNTIRRGKSRIAILGGRTWQPHSSSSISVALEPLAQNVET